MKVDGSQLEAILNLLADVGPNEESLVNVESAIGHELPAETRKFVRAGVELWNPQVEFHPTITILDFDGDLPNVDTFLENLEEELKGEFLSVCHFIGLYPVGWRLRMGTFEFVLVSMEEHSPGLGGVMNYIEQIDICSAGPTCSAFLLEAIREYYESWRNAIDDEDSEFDEETDNTEMDLEDVFLLDYENDDAPSKAEPLPAKIETAWERLEEQKIEQYKTRMWIPDFLRGKLGPDDHNRLPAAETWEKQKETVAQTYGNAMYWTLAHALLGNVAGLDFCLEKLKNHPGKFVQALCQAAPGLVSAYEEKRAKLGR